ncbi:MAG: M6 family metalloprotease domain-containing protein [Muribaculaceae bacterium]|nr:M6 family metalloprotease domain-containing protein [Muribaculaceae bacterium]
MLLTAEMLMAVPARRTPITVDGPSGPTTVRLYGDENFHYYVDEADGSLLLREGDTFVAADFDASGRLVPSSTRVKASRRKAMIDSAPCGKRRSIPGLVEGTTFPAFGKQKVAVVLVEYQDVKFNLSDPLDYFSRMLNEEGFSDYYATGSARDWFIHSSGGMFEPEFDVFGPITLQKSQEYYGGNDALKQDNAPQKMVIEACRQLNATVDFSAYDCDKDGVIDNVFVVYAGRGEASGGSSNCVWPHAWTLNAAEPGQVYTFDGVRLNRYACCNEWELSDLGHGYRPVGIGTFVHEFSHVMGLPDLYSTKYVEDTFTLGAWSAMDYGPYNNDGCTPPQYSAWERASLGYFTPQALPASGNIALEPLESGAAYMVPTADPDEYFILENRQQSGWDEFIPGHGMLVWHIDYDADVWSSNTLNNNPAHNHVDLIEADNTRDKDSRDGDCFPGAAGVTALSASTTPALRTWSGAATEASLHDIAEIGSRVVFRLNGGAPDIDAPEALAASGVKAGAFVANWKEVDGALGYRLALYSGDELVRTLNTEQCSVEVDGLTPSTDYSYTVCADDGVYGSKPSACVPVRTLDPTFDYFAPAVLAAAEVEPESFVARWEPMTDAREYFLTVYRQFNGEAKLIDYGFDGGVDALPEGWTSTSTASYGMSSYSGASAPSLRLSRDGDELTVDFGGEILQSFSCWHRGNGTTEAETLDILCRIDGEWIVTDTYTVVTDKGGAQISCTKPDKDADAIKVVFRRPGKGAVAIDDVSICFDGPLLESVEPAYDALSVGSATSKRVEGLDKGCTYLYTVHATDGTFTSRISDKVKVTLPEHSGVEDVAVEAGAGLSIAGRHITSEGLFDVYTPAGLSIAMGVDEVTLPAAGLYIVLPRGGKALKVAIK